MKITANAVAAATHLFRNDGWLSRTSPAFQDAMFAQVQWFGVDAGATVSHGGDEHGGMFGLASGALSVISAEGPPDAPPIHIAQAPHWFGTNPLVSGRPRNVSMVARSPCLLALVPQHAMAAMLDANPGWWRFISLSLTELLAVSLQVNADLLIRDSRRRCVSVLLRIAERRSSGDAPVTVKVDQDEFAAMANMSRQTASPILHALAAAGLIATGYGSITLNDPAALRAIVNG